MASETAVEGGTMSSARFERHISSGLYFTWIYAQSPTSEVTIIISLLHVVSNNLTKTSFRAFQ